MKRRDFLKAIGLGSAALTAPLSLFAHAQAKSENRDTIELILDRVDDRIEKHRKADAELKLAGPDGKTLPAGAAVNIEQTNHKFLFGCNIFDLNRCANAEANEAYADHFADLLNYATLPFYWARYEPEKGKEADARTREIVQWCKANNVTPKGHPLVWNLADPKWLPKDPHEAMKVQFERARRCTERFKGGIDIWDVVNEATEYDRQHFLERAPILTEAITKMGVGQYVRQAFRAARKGNLDATLIINDYKADSDFEQKVISELVDENNHPLYDVIGIQSHMHTAYWGLQKAWNVCERFTKYGKPLHFTELTILSGRLKTDDDWFSAQENWPTTAEGEKRQAQQVVELYSVLFSHPAVEAITWWDFADYEAWQGAPAGFIRKDMTPKPAYLQLRDLIKNKWWTKTKTTVDLNGKMAFRGFLGQYKLTANINGRLLTTTFCLNKDLKKTIDVRLT
ncbi:MAG: endo-1,4-beta-xylanase [Planctomycetota bacterium]|jgi:GH35 family endo-1,4-beta-xylanase